jgi:hypothetical protein
MYRRMTPDAAFLFSIFEIATIIITIVVFVYLFILSIVVNDYKLIVEKPFLFTIEFLFMTFLPSIPILFFAISRGLLFAKAFLLATSFAVQAALFHIVFQLSGVYRYSFGV